jgi:dTDP-4-dehydrorhamnose reductase
MSCILLLGSTGLLGATIRDELTAKKRFEVIGVSRKPRVGSDIQADIGDDTTLNNLLNEIEPEQVINCAALTSIDECESKPLDAWRINARPLLIISDWSRRTGKPFIHISTDHFYSDDGAKAHSETDEITLLHEYARSKFAGEQFALSAPNGLIIRTSIMGFRGWGAQSFLEWAWDVVEHDRQASLFDDAFSSTIDVKTFAKKSLQLFEKGYRGLYNLAASEVFSKEDVVRELARQRNVTLSNASVGSVRQLKVHRGNSLGLDVSKASAALDTELPTLSDTITKVVADKLKRGNDS